MKTALTCLILSFIFTLTIYSSCRKKNDNPCQGKTKPSGQFVMKEMIGDTAFIADTIFRDNYVQFQALDRYESIVWKLGADPRVWTDSTFSLSFINELGQLSVNFVGKKSPNTLCFPNDNGTYSTAKNLTMVEQVEKPYVTISPLVGKYMGYFTDNPSDTFTVRMEYFDSTKYDASITGAKNFYWFSNMPKGFAGTTSASYVYKELQNGLSVEMGYKCFVFGTGSSIVQGKGWLANDTLFIIYGNDLVGRKKFIGKKL
ncbi:MAG: hypothetical protein K2Q24_09680 [Chitinophagaceae bacterium]|jgi:hypothetical protein|nr:hypothetical protein [Chitinophagaceae bacterium]